MDAGELELFQALRVEEGRLSLRCDLLWRVPGRQASCGAARQRIQGMPAGDLA